MPFYFRCLRRPCIYTCSFIRYYSPSTFSCISPVLNLASCEGGSSWSVDIIGLASSLKYKPRILEFQRTLLVIEEKISRSYTYCHTGLLFGGSVYKLRNNLILPACSTSVREKKLSGFINVSHAGRFSRGRGPRIISPSRGVRPMVKPEPLRIINTATLSSDLAYQPCNFLRLACFFFLSRPSRNMMKGKDL